MKNRWLILTAMMLVLAACKKGENTSTDTTASVSDTTTTSTMSPTASDTGATTSTTAAAAATPVSDADKTFMTKAAQGGMAEVALGTLASQNGQNADVKSFGNRMVTDHGQANDELKSLAANKGVTLPTELDADGKKTQDALSKKTGAAFDKAYIADMVKDHEKDVAEFEKESKSAQDPDLKAWVSKTLPTLQDHLKMAKDTKGKVK